MSRNVTTHMMFEGFADEAMTLYVSLFGNSRIVQIEKCGAGQTGAEGLVKPAKFSLVGREFLCIDSPAKLAFTFTPSISLFVECESESELNSAFGKLSESGAVLMPIGGYGFSKKFGWITDRFGISWQLNLA